MHSVPDRRKRRYPRYRVDFPVSVTMLVNSEYQTFDAHGKDLAEAGIGVLVATELTIGEVASFKFSLPGSSDIWEIRAVLRHRRGYHYGFEFLSIRNEQKQYLKKYLETLERAD
ncbi:MAG TPA: PilZ domain-containing protein [Candidatus Sulfotelmatobacter sp.]|nr:PilZ domain-containing protein [Candidatus Sulfotelmatobacter sp.]